MKICISFDHHLTMFTAERREAIQNLITQNERVDVVELSALYGVSEVTIRKDLEYLEKNGVLIRTHGGAVINKYAASGSEFGDATSTAAAGSYSLIARMAADIVRENELIYLGTGPVCSAIASALLEKQNLTIVTNNLSAASVLAKSPRNHVILAGGQVGFDGDLAFSYGNEVNAYLSQNTYDKSFMAIDGVNPASGFLLQNADVFSVYSSVLEKAATTIFCVPGDRFDRNAFFQLAPVSFPKMVVSDGAIPENYIRLFSEHAISVFTSYDLLSM